MRSDFSLNNNNYWRLRNPDTVLGIKNIYVIVETARGAWTDGIVAS